MGGRVKCSLIFDRFPSLFVFVGQDLQVGIKPQQCCGELSVTDRRFSCIFLQTMARSAQQTVAPMGHLSPFYLQFSYKCAYLPLPWNPTPYKKWRDELLMSDRPAVRGILCSYFKLADVERLCLYIYYNLVYELWCGEEVNEAVLFFSFLGRLQKFKKVLPVYSTPNGFPFGSPFLLFHFFSHRHDCLSATRYNSMLVLYKVRNGGLQYCFCNKSERCKKAKKKKNCTYFKTLWAEKLFSPACFPSCLIGYLLYL